MMKFLRLYSNVSATHYTKVIDLLRLYKTDKEKYKDQYSRVLTCYVIWNHNQNEIKELRKDLNTLSNGYGDMNKLLCKLDKKIVKLTEYNDKLKINLGVCKNDYWFMTNLLEKYSSNLEMSVKDCIYRMNFRKGLFSILKDK